MIDQLISKFWTLFYLWLILFVFLIISIMFLSVSYYKKRKIVKKHLYPYIFLSLIVFVLTIFSSFKLYNLISDIRYVRSNQCEIFNGEFVKYNVYVESNTPGSPRGSFPVFIDNTSEETIILTGTQEFEIGKTYTIFYLPNSMVYVFSENE